LRKPEWLFVIALLLVGAYFSYRYFARPEKFNPLQLIPRSASLVYEVQDPFKVYKQLAATELWSGLEEIEQINQAFRAIQLSDSLLNLNNRTKGSLRSLKTIASIHVTGNESAGLMLYLPTGAAAVSTLEAVVAEITEKQVQRQTRLYDDYTIGEIIAGTTSLSYILYDKYIVFSTYGFLIEDVVRNINNNLDDGFFVNHANLYTVPKLGDDVGNLYLNGAQLTPLANTLLPPKANKRQQSAESGYLDFSVTASKLFLSGFFYDASGQGFVSLFKNQEAGRPESVNLVSENAAEVMVLNVSDLQAWYLAWRKNFALGQEFTQTLLPFIKGDIALPTFYTNNDPNDKLLIARLADKEGVVNLLNRKAEEIASAKNDTVYFEQYADLKIGLIEEEEYLGKMLGPPFSGFDNTYFTVYENFLVLAPSVQRIKTWLNDIENDLIWSRSVEKSDFIAANLNETSFALVYTNPWAWRILRDTFNEASKEWWTTNEEKLKQFGLVSFQFANLDNRYYAEIKVEYNPQQVYAAQQEFADELLTQFAGKLSVKPKLVRNHNNNEWEVFIQDSAAFISLLDDQGELLWTDSLTGNITTEIYQLDFYKNRKLQYLFGADSTIHIVDRNGVAIENYPKSISGISIKDLYLLDYDKSRNYRFLVSDFTGNLYMLNQEGEPLAGWDPLAVNSEISDQVYHVRVRGNDRIVIGLKNGMVELRNRRGEIQDGFPFDLEFNLDNPLHFKTGSTFANSRFTAISSEGIVVEFDLNGREYAREQVDEPSSSARFSMAIDKARNDLVFYKQDLNRLTLINKEGQQIFEKDYDTDNALDLQYYYLGVDKRLYIVRDKVNGRLFLYNKTGNLVNENPLFSDYPISVVYRKKEAKCYIYTANNQSVEIKSFTF
jgi:hypothetical protein